MSGKTLITIFLFVSVLCIGVYGQSRNDVVIFIEPTAGGSQEENAFFDNNLSMEVGAANYTVTKDRSEADYILIPKVGLNPPAQGIPARSLVLRLVRNSDSVEIIQLGNDYDEVTEAYEWNLFLIYQAMANVPLSKNANDPPPQLLARQMGLFRRFSPL
jgi:hypothetical protein